MNIRKHVFMPVAMLGLTACSYTNHFLDEEEDKNDTATYSTLTDINASAYDKWTYVNLQTGEMETHPDASEWIYAGDGTLREAQEEEKINIDWHIAIHRYEIKTNEALVMNTGKTDIQTVTELPEGTYSADYVAAYEDELTKGEGETQYVLMMAGVMTNNTAYAHRPTINKVLCDGIVRTATGSMPPTIYSSTGEVFALKWNNGSWAVLQITEAYSTTGSSGYISLKCKYHSAE